MRSVKYTLAGLALGAVLLQMPSAVWGQGTAVGKKGYSAVSPAQAKELIEKKEDLLLIDVRSLQEFQQGALPGSTLIPWWKILKGDHQLPKEKPILLVCAVGGRSLAVGKYLAARGYSEIYNLSGGLSAWAKQRVPLPEKKSR